MSIILIIAIFLCLEFVNPLDNGLLMTPPMGWMSWERYACNIDCDNYPNDCINERLYMEMAERLASDGYKDVGYKYVSVDDCWAQKERDPHTKRLVADRVRFPSGIKALADFVHSKGLLFGIYGDVGNYTCQRYPGQLGPNGDNYNQIDADTYAEWGVDSLKLDGCHTKEDDYPILYPAMSKALNATHRPIAYACSWPAYRIDKYVDYDTVSKYCNYWRNFDDIEDSWANLTNIIDFYAKYQDLFAKYNGPGQWNDADMLIIGNFGLSYEQSKTQMALWAMWSSPLFMSNNLRQIRDEYKEILLNKDVIAVNQDALGSFGKRVYKDTKGIEIWVKSMTPIVKESNSYAIVYFNRRTLGTPNIVSKPLSLLIPTQTKNFIYYVNDLFDNSKLIAVLKSSDNLTLTVNPAGSVRMVKLTPYLIISDEEVNENVIFESNNKLEL